jgi:hypothetical protein
VAYATAALAACLPAWTYRLIAAGKLTGIHGEAGNREPRGPERPLGEATVWKLLRKCRRAAAKRSPAQRQLGWHLEIAELLRESGLQPFGSGTLNTTGENRC